MGVDFYLACNTCHEFVDLHKWPVVKEAGEFLVHAYYDHGEYKSQLYPEDSPYQFIDLTTSCKKIIVTSDQIRHALVQGYPQHQYILDLHPIVLSIANKHEGHELFLSCDMGCSSKNPWSPDQSNFAKWLQIPGVFNYDHFLPRNLIKVYKLTNWPDAFDEPLQTIFNDAYLTDKQLTVIQTEFRKLLAE